MNLKRLHRLGALFLAVVLALSMAVTPAMAANPTSISIMLDGKAVTNQTITVEQGELIKLECVDQSGSSAKVTWSKDGNGVTMNQSGGVRGQTPGTTTTITAKAVDENGAPVTDASGREITATCQVTVREPVPVTSVMLNESTLTLARGLTAQLTAVVFPTNADSQTVTWTSSNASVAAVDSNGLVTAAGEGTAIITAEAGGKTAQCTVTVNPTPTASRITLSQTTLQLAGVGDTKTLEYTLTPEGAQATVTWSSSNTSVAVVDQTGTVVAMKVGTAVITATTEKNLRATCTVTVRAPVPATSVTLNQTTVRLNPGGTAQLTAAVLPSNTTSETVWESSNTSVATVDDKGLVTATGIGAAEIKVAAGNKYAICNVYVGNPPDAFTAEDVRGNKIPTNNTLDLGLSKAPESQRVVLTVEPSNSVFTYESVVWSVENTDGKADQSVIRVAKDPASFGTGGRSAVVTAVGPGRAVLVVTYGERRSQWNVEIPGITLRGNVKTITNGQLSLWEGEVETLLVDRFGSADNSGNIVWYSSDESIVSVYNGRLTARMPGTVKVTASLVGYADAEVTVVVQEDTSALVQAGGVTAGGSINLSTIASQLSSISLTKTGSALSYITNLSVATSQGIVHDSYRSEPDTGAGVGAADRYYLSANTALGQSPLSDLSFVAKNTFSGTADISYTGVTTDNRSFTGTIRVTVAAANDVFYTAVVGQALSFQSDDFNRICQSKQGGRSLNSISFTLPQSSWGELRYDYNGSTHTGQAVTSGTQYYRTRTPSLDRVSFIPSSTCPSSVAISYRGTDANGGTYSGVITISVTKQSGAASSSDVHFSGLRGERVAFTANAFNLACYSTVGEQLSYVRFNSLPAAGEGTLYINYLASGSYSGTASANTSYYVSGTPSLNTLSFVSTSTASDQIAIPYTGYGVRGTVYTGTVYIDLDETGQTGIRYTVTSGKTVSFNVNDFNNACIKATGASLNYVRFSTTPTSTQGYLRYRYTTGSSYGTVSTSLSCYRVSPNSYSSTPLIGNVYFQANISYVGTVTLPYTGYNTNGVSFTGEVVIQVTPNTVTYTGTNAFPLQISASQIASACSELMSKPLSYITLTNLPATTTGRLYVGYTKLGTGTAANTGTKYYVSSNPSINQISFVPRGRYTGQVEVGYTAVSTSGETVTGRIIFNIVEATSSRYFTDMTYYVWAASAADYLRLNEISNGYSGNTTFGPGQKVMRRDFMVMLNRAFKFPSAGSYSFSDVPTNEYYSQALASAKQLGIVSATDNRFRPNEGLTREDAMVMIYNTLVAMGKNPPRGTEADLTRFSDNALVSSSARNAVASLVQLGVIRGSNGQLNPKETITRAETAIILHYVLTM